jgi:prevent-host-death family protein
MVSDHGRISMTTATKPVSEARIIPAGEFKAKCLQLLDEVAEKREPIVVTKHGIPVAQLVPVPGREPLFGAMKGSVLWEGDIISPLDVEWDANK